MRQELEVPIKCWEQFYKIADMYGEKAYWCDREDLRHDIVIKLYEAYRIYDNLTDALIHTIARNCVKDFWRAYKRRQDNTMSLDKEFNRPYAYENGETLTFADVLSSDTTASFKKNGKRRYAYSEASEPERMAENDIEDDRLQEIPRRLILIRQRQLSGYPLSKADRQWVWRYNKK